MAPAKPKSKRPPKRDTDGAATARSRSVANDLASGRRHIKEGELGTPLPRHAMPLDVMLMAMRKAYIEGGSTKAFPIAKECAVYMHARIASVELRNPEDQDFRLEFKWAGETPRPAATDITDAVYVNPDDML